jgi:hypothetical protein
MANETNSQVITLEGLGTFYALLKQKFLTENGASALFEPIGGGSSQFTAQSFNIGGEHGLTVSYDTLNSLVVFSVNGYSTSFLVKKNGNLELASKDDVNSLADLLSVYNNKISKTYPPCVYEGSVTIASFSGDESQLNSAMSNAVSQSDIAASVTQVGKIILFKASTNNLARRFYVVTEVESGVPTKFEYVGTPSIYGVYYNKNSMMLYYYTGTANDPFVPIATGGGGSYDPEEIIPADSEAIAYIISQIDANE